MVNKTRQDLHLTYMAEIFQRLFIRVSVPFNYDFIFFFCVLPNYDKNYNRYIKTYIIKNDKQDKPY